MIMDNQTAYWLLSAIIQGLGAIWAIFFGISIAVRSYIKGVRKKIPNMRFRRSEKWYLISVNLITATSIITGLLGLVYFRNDGLIYISLFTAITSIIMLASYLTYLVATL